MRPVLFVWRGVAVRSFPVVTYAALLLAVFLTVHFARSDGLDPDRVALAVVCMFIPGFVGARLLHAYRHWDHFRRDPARLLRRADGGLSLYGGLIGVAAGSIPVLWTFDLPFARFWDALVLGLLGGLVVAKSGCFLNGCCFGRRTDHWCGLDLPDDHGRWHRRFPSQLLEMVWAGFMLLLMMMLRDSAPPPGVVASATIALHPVGRVFLQRLRDEGRAEDASVLKTCVVLMLAGAGAGVLAWLH